MVKIKKGYILLALLAAVVYFFISYQKSKTRDYFTKIGQDIITHIRHQDYFVIHQQLNKDLQSRISIEDIKKFITPYEFSREAKFILHDYDKDKDAIKIVGFIKDKNKTFNTKISIKEQNNTLVINALEINKDKLKKRKFSFPIVLEKKSN